MFRFLTALFLVLITFAACSRAGDPVIPISPEDTPLLKTGEPLASFDSTDNGTDIWGEIDIAWDRASGEIAFDSRSADIALRHYKVSYFLTPPWCPDCIQVDLINNDPTLGTAEVDITLRNPTSLWAYDVRGVMRVPSGTNLRLLNASGYTNLFETAGYTYPAPFRTFAQTFPQHEFEPGAYFTEAFDLKADPGNTPVDFNLLVTAAHPAPAGDVSGIGEFRQSGRLLDGGGSALMGFAVEDLQDDIAGVLLHTSPLGGGDVWLTLSSGRWEALVTNYTASPGLYELKVDAYSPNLQGGVTSQFYRAVVFHDLSEFRSQLLDYVNADRASNGLGPLAIDADLNTTAQSHAQDMSDREYFSHTNLDGWSPWDRMAYYGVEFSTAGENIAVGQDTPYEVESAWMNSPGHKANILNGSFGEIGLGIAPTQDGDMYAPGYYWVQAFTN